MIKVDPQTIKEAFPQVNFILDHPLKEKTYFKIGGPAQVYLETDDENLLANLVGWCQQNHFPLTIIGGASNVIVSDAGIEGLVVKLKNDQVAVIDQDKNVIEVGAGLKTALLVQKCLELELAGLEYFLGVPGSVGGAIFNNAHYLDSLISDHILAVKIISGDGSISWIDKDEAGFGYDQSRFHHSGEVILGGRFGLKQGNRQDSQALISEATLYRARTQPLGEPSSGCIFQNAPNTDQLKDKFPQFAANKFLGGGFLIDQAGCKGMKVGGISVSHKHAAFFINDGTGTSAEVLELITQVKQRVREQFGVELKEEVFFLS